MIINYNRLSNIKNDLNDKLDNFNRSYNSFNSLKSTYCKNSILIDMNYKLSNYYAQIQKDFNKINKYIGDFFQTAKGIEDTICEKVTTISDPMTAAVTRNYLANLEECKNDVDNFFERLVNNFKFTDALNLNINSDNFNLENFANFAGTLEGFDSIISPKDLKNDKTLNSINKEIENFQKELEDNLKKLEENKDMYKNYLKTGIKNCKDKLLNVLNESIRKAKQSNSGKLGKLSSKDIEALVKKIDKTDDILEIFAIYNSIKNDLNINLKELELSNFDKDGKYSKDEIEEILNNQMAFLTLTNEYESKISILQTLTEQYKQGNLENYYNAITQKGDFAKISQTINIKTINPDIMLQYYNAFQYEFTNEELAKMSMDDFVEYDDSYCNYAGIINSLINMYGVDKLEQLLNEISIDENMLNEEELKEHSKFKEIIFGTQYTKIESDFIGKYATGLRNTLSKMKYMTQDEKNMFIYLWQTNGKSDADSYYSYLKQELLRREGEATAKLFIEENKKLDGATAYIDCFLKGLGDGAEGFFDNLNNVFNANGEMSANDYEALYIMDYLQNKYGNDCFSGTGFYEVGNSIGNMAPAMLANAIPLIGPVASKTLFGFSTFGGAYEQVLQNGYSGWDAIGYAFSNAVSEVGLEYFIGKIPGLSKLSGSYIKNILGEAVEEGSQEFIDGMFLSPIFLGQEANIDWEAIKKSAIYGGMTSGILNVSTAPNVINDFMNAAKTTKEINNAIKTFNNLIKGSKTDNVSLVKESLKAIGFSDTDIETIINTSSETINTKNTIKNAVNQKFQNTINDISNQINLGIETLIANTSNKISNFQANITSVTNLLQNGVKALALQINQKNNTTKTSELLEKGRNIVENIHYTNSTTISDIVDTTLNDIETNINDVINNMFSLKETAKGALASFVTSFARIKTSKITKNSDIFNKIKDNGLYHVTSENSADKILESGYVGASGKLKSYGKNKSYFFPGLPAAQDVIVNLNGIASKLVAVKFNASAESITDFRYRAITDNAVSYEGDYYFDKSSAEKVYLGLTMENGQLTYKEISKEQYDSYSIDSLSSKLENFKMKMKNIMNSMAIEVNLFNNSVNALKNSLSNSYEKVKSCIENISNIFHNLYVNFSNKNAQNVNVNFSKISSLAKKGIAFMTSNQPGFVNFDAFKNQKNYSSIEEFAKEYDELNKKIRDINYKLDKKFSDQRKLKKLLKEKADMDLLLNTVLSDAQNVESSHGFQVFDYNQAQNIMQGGFKTLLILNNKGYMSNEFGNYFKNIFDSGKYDIRIHKGHSMNKDNIFQNGLIVNGVKMQGGDKRLDNTTIKCESLFDFVMKMKNVGTHSEGFQPTDGVYIVAIPKGLSEENVLIRNNTGKVLIDPKYILGYASSVNGVVGDLEFRSNNNQNKNKNNYNPNEIIDFIIKTQDQKHNNGLISLKHYFQTGDSSVITRSVRDLLGTITKEDIAKYLNININSESNAKKTNNPNEIIDFIIKTQDQKHNNGLISLKHYFQTGDSSVITRSVRDLLGTITKEDIAKYLNININSESNAKKTNNPNEIIDFIIKTQDQKHNNGLISLKHYFQTGDSSVITRSVRDLLGTITKEDIAKYLNINSESNTKKTYVNESKIKSLVKTKISNFITNNSQMGIIHPSSAFFLNLFNRKNSNNKPEIINVKDLKPKNANNALLDKPKFDKPKFDVNLTYDGYDYLYRDNNNLNLIINEIINNNDISKKYLIEINNTKDLTMDLINKIPSNVDVRVISGYTEEFMNGLKSPNVTPERQFVTYTTNELKEIMSEINNFENGIDPNWSDLEKAHYAYDYLKNNIKYNPNPGPEIQRTKNFNSLTGLIDKESTCIGFSIMYKELLDRMGIKCTVIGGKYGKQQHAYNIININNNNFLVDVVRPSFTNGENGFKVSDTSNYKAKNNGKLLESIQQDASILSTIVANKIEQAQIHEANITSQLKFFEDDNNKLIGLNHKFKSQESLSRKVESDALADNVSYKEAAKGINDVLRYTFQIDINNYKQKILYIFKKLKSEGYKIKKFKNSWGNALYQGINTQLISPEGYQFELQFHTEQSFYTKKLNHKWYEIVRSFNSTLEQKSFANQKMKENQSKVIAPDGIIGLELR